jgi:hypothetical protein
LTDLAINPGVGISLVAETRNIARAIQAPFVNYNFLVTEEPESLTEHSLS